MSDDPNGIEQARAARRRAEQELEEMKAKRPEVKELAAKAVRFRDQNHLSQLVMAAFRRSA